jgi:hypothetical protein
MKNDKILTVDAVKMVRKIRDDNYKIFKNKNRTERLKWVNNQAKKANKIFANS